MLQTLNPILRSLAVMVPLTLATGCLSSGVRSTGATLPQTNDTFDDGELKVKVKHDCSGARCTALSAEFENLGEGKIEIVPSASKVARAGESFPLRRKGEEKGNIVIGPKGKADGEFEPVSKEGKPLSYVRAQQVWCSLKVDTQCKDPSKGEAMCAGFARYYHQSYISAGGWITVEFGYKNYQNKLVKLSTTAPAFFGDAPSVQLTKNSDAPSWISSSDEVVFHKVECNDKCVCSDVGGRRNFFTDDKFLPVAQ